jgi:hypothetical protein
VRKPWGLRPQQTEVVSSAAGVLYFVMKPQVLLRFNRREVRNSGEPHIDLDLTSPDPGRRGFSLCAVVWLSLSRKDYGI